MNQVDLVRQAFGLSRDADLAELCGVAFQAVGAWRKRNAIPPARRWQLVELAASRGVELPREFWPEDLTIPPQCGSKAA